jgi:peptidoglycan hydrolase CwlO-like protein
MLKMDIQKIFQEVVVPDLKRLQGSVDQVGLEQKNIHTEIKRLDEKVGSLRSEMKSEFRRIDDKVDVALDIRERRVILESKVAVLGR